MTEHPLWRDEMPRFMQEVIENGEAKMTFTDPRRVQALRGRAYYWAKKLGIKVRTMEGWDCVYVSRVDGGTR